MRGRKDNKKSLVWLKMAMVLGVLTSLITTTPGQQNENVELIGFAGGVMADVFVKGNIAYCAAGHGLSIFDVSTPTKPIVLANILLPGQAISVHVSGQYAYVAARWAGLRIIDVSNPTSPKSVGYYDTPGDAVKVYVSGKYAYVADRSAGLRIIDVSNPSSLKEVGYYVTTHAMGIYVAGQYAYVVDAVKGLLIIDISDPSSPREIGRHET